MADDKSSSSMQSDHYFAEMLGMMRDQGKKDNPTTIQLGVMQSASSVKIDDLVLNAEDLYIADYLVAGYTRTIKVPYVSGVTVDTTQSDGWGYVDGEGVYHDPDTKTTTQKQITYTDGLQKGDLVVVEQLANTNKFVILARVKEA